MTDVADTYVSPGGHEARRASRALAATVATLLLAGAITYLVLAIVQRMDSKTPVAGDEAVAAGRTQALNIMTLNYGTAKRDLQRVVDTSIGKMHDQYAQAESGTIATATSEKSVSTGTILSAGLSSLKGNTAEVLVAGDATVAFPASGKTKAGKVKVHYRFRLEMQKTKNGWRSSQLAFAGLPSYSQVTS